MSLRVVHYYALGRSHRSGVTAAIDGWMNALAGRGADVLLVTAEGEIPESYYGVPVNTVAHTGRGRMGLIPRASELGTVLQKADVLVLHEGWTPSHYAAARLATKLQVPYVVMPHGVYEPEVMRGLRALKVRLRLERRLLVNAAAVHLYFDSERALIRDVARAYVAAVVEPTGLPLVDTHGADEGAWVGGASVLWFGRMDVYHKGLDLLLRGLALLPGSSRPQVTLAGYDYEGGRQKVRGLVRELQLADVVEVRGPIWGAEKHAALMSAVAYVHPSRWECHSIALLEALASGVPALISSSIHVAPLLQEMGVASVVDPSPSSWADALAALQADPPQGATEKQRVNLLGRFDWEHVASATLERYGELAHADA